MTLYKGTQKVCPIVTVGTTPTLTTKNITQNGTYNASSDNADGYSSVTVNVPTVTPTGTISINSNGTYDVTNYASANVSVSGGGGITTLSCYRNERTTGKFIYIDENKFTNNGAYYNFRGYSGSNQYARIAVTKSYFSDFVYDATNKVIFDLSGSTSYKAYPSGDISFN